MLQGTADYYSYCEEGSSGLMVWTNNSAKNCYGWYYEYHNGSRISKVNMLKLKAIYPSLNDGNVGPNLIKWCNANGFYCSIVMTTVYEGGKYLLALLLA